MQFRLPRDNFLGLLDVDLTVRASNREQLRSFREKLRRAALVGLDVRVFVTDDAVERLAKLRKGERIRGRAVEDKINRAIDLENFAHTFANSRCPAIVAVRWGSTDIRFLQSRQCFRTDPGRVVTGEFVTLSVPRHIAAPGEAEQLLPSRMRLFTLNVKEGAGRGELIGSIRLDPINRHEPREQTRTQAPA
jgi:hypothetical protein